MVKNHIKRISAPKRWNILRKENTFISRPNPGRDLKMCLSLNTVLKDMLHKTKTTRESKYLLTHKEVLVNGVKRHDEKFPVGLFDVVTITELKENFRLLIDGKDRIVVYKIPEAEASVKMSKVKDKTMLSKDIIQVNCTDGRNFLMKKDEAKGLSTNDTIFYSMPDNKVKDIFKLEKGSLVLLYKGKHVGNLVTVEDFKENKIVFKKEQEVFETNKSYAFAIGKGKAAITLPK